MFQFDSRIRSLKLPIDALLRSISLGIPRSNLFI